MLRLSSSHLDTGMGSEAGAFANLNLLLELGNDLVVENAIGPEGSLGLIDHSGDIVDVVGLQLSIEGIDDCLYLVWLGIDRRS